MNSASDWSDHVPDRDGVKSTINEVAFSPDGTRLIAAVGNRVLLYDAESGNLIDSLRGHKDTVLSVDFSADGTRFASGGADKVVVIWKSSGQGLLKFNHNSPVQRVRYNPVMMQLASCADEDFGYWTPEQKQVQKDKLNSKALSACWNADGTLLAIGLQSGMITVRNGKTEEVCRIDRSAPVWCLTFAMGNVPNPSVGKVPANPPTSDTEVLMVGCWDKTISSYKISLPVNNVNVPAIKACERNIKFYPTSISITGGLTSKNSFLLVTGANKKCTLYSRDCMKLTELTTKSSWVWSCCTPHHGTNSNKLAIGCDNGDIDVMSLKFDNVYAINPERYAFRENLTEIVVQHLITDRKVRIKCRDLVQKLALYKNKLAVQVSDKVFIYESNADDFNDIHFRLKKERVTHNIVSERMAVSINNLIFSNQKVLTLYTFDGIKLRSWIFESRIMYFKMDAGLEDKECVVCSLEDGSMVKIFIDNPFPLEIGKHEITTNGNKLKKNGLICVDMNLHRSLIASVDENKNLLVTDIKSQEVLFRYTGVIYVCFNQEVDDMLCFSTDTSMYVVSGLNAVNAGKAPAPTVTSMGGRDRSGGTNNAAPAPAIRSNKGDDIVPQEQHIGGPATALIFSGQRLYCLYRGLMTTLDIPQGNNIASAIEAGDYDNAYHLACLGATSADWKLLGMKALRSNHITIAKNCFARLQDTKYLSLIDTIETSSGRSEDNSSKAGRSPDVRRNNRNTNDSLKSSSTSDVLPLDITWQAEILAYEGHATEAAKIYARANKLPEAIRLLTELRRWKDAKLFAQNAVSTGGNSKTNAVIDLNELTLKQAKWLQEINDWRGASELHMTLGQCMQACKIIVESNMNTDVTPASGAPGAPGASAATAPWRIYLLEIMRRVPKEQAEVLNYCGDIFVQIGEDEMARETWVKLNNISKLMFLFGRKQMWNDAAKLAEEHPGEFDCSVFLPYAEWLLSQDKYMDAMSAYKKANRRDLSRKVLEELTYNSVVESRFKDAGYYYWLLSREYESLAVELMNSKADSKGNPVKSSEGVDGGKGQPVLSISQCQQQHIECEHKADLYYAYSTIHSFIMDPYTSHQSETLFQMCRFIINSLGSNNTDNIVPYGISKGSTYYTLGKQAMRLQCYKLARYSFERLSKLQLSLKKHEDEIELDMLLIQAKPMHDNPDYAPACYRCGATNPLLNPFTNKFAKGDVCTSCGHPFVRSFINYDILPLVEFVPDPSISDEEAIELIRSPAVEGNAMGKNTQRGAKNDWRESKDGGANVLSLDDDEVEEDTPAMSRFGGHDGIDLFTKCLNKTLEKQNNCGYIPVTVDANTLSAMKRMEIFVCKPSSKHKRATFYRNMLPDIAIAISQPCHRFFHLEDFEFTYLSEQNCPYSRLKNIGEYGSL